MRTATEGAPPVTLGHQRLFRAVVSRRPSVSSRQPTLASLAENVPFAGAVAVRDRQACGLVARADDHTLAKPRSRGFGALPAAGSWPLWSQKLRTRPVGHGRQPTSTGVELLKRIPDGRLAHRDVARPWRLNRSKRRVSLPVRVCRCGLDVSSPDWGGTGDASRRWPREGSR